MGVKKIGQYQSVKENVDEDILLLGSQAPLACNLDTNDMGLPFPLLR